MSAERAHKKDSRYLIPTVKSTKERLEKMGLQVKTVLADAGFSSGENYAALNALNLNSYIPLHGTYKPTREGFTYDGQKDIYTCSQGKELAFRQMAKSGGYYKKRYLSKKKICDQCPVRVNCVGKRGYKKLEHTIYKAEYDEMIKRLKSERGQMAYKLRMHTVEPVFGTLQQHYGLRWINTRLIDGAHKVMLMAAAALNLKKLVKHRVKKGFLFTFLGWKSLWRIIEEVPCVSSHRRP